MKKKLDLPKIYTFSFFRETRASFNKFVLIKFVHDLYFQNFRKLLMHFIFINNFGFLSQRNKCILDFYNDEKAIRLGTENVLVLLF